MIAAASTRKGGGTWLPPKTRKGEMENINGKIWTHATAYLLQDHEKSPTISAILLFIMNCRNKMQKLKSQLIPTKVCFVFILLQSQKTTKILYIFNGNKLKAPFSVILIAICLQSRGGPWLCLLTISEKSKTQIKKKLEGEVIFYFFLSFGVQLFFVRGEDRSMHFNNLIKRKTSAYFF